MTIALNHGHTIISCDSCDEIYEGDETCEFEVLWQTAKQDGWHARRAGKDWVHSCPKCGVPT